MNDQDFMRAALEEAQKAFDKNEVPIGAVIVKDGEIIGRGHNLRESSNRAISHAEIMAIEDANQHLESWRLDTCTLYVTIEPCPMCTGAIIQSRIQRVVYGALDYKAGTHKSITNLFDHKWNHSVSITSGVLEKECKDIMKQFFKTLRK